MALPIIDLSTTDIRAVLFPGMAADVPTTFQDLCTCPSVNEYGLDATYCPDLGSGKLANLRTAPYDIGKFRNYNPAVLEISPDFFNADGYIVDSKVITVNSTVPWTTTPSQPWISRNPISGGPSGSFTISTSINPTVSPRTGTLTVSGNGVASKNVNISQSAGPPTLSATPTVYNRPYGPFGEWISVTSNTTYTSTSDVGWITILESISPWTKISVSQNNGATARVGHVTISTNAPTGASQVITINQAAFAATLSVTPNAIVRGNYVSGFNTVTVTSNTTWSAVSDSAWLTISDVTGTNFRANVSQNDSANSRTGYITVSTTNSVGTQLSSVVTVTQPGKTPYLTIFTSYTDFNSPASGAVGNLVNSNTEWTASSDVAWLAALSEKVVTYPEQWRTSHDIQINYGLTERIGHITYYSTNPAGLSQLFTVRQGPWPSLIMTPETFSIAEGGASGQSIDVQSNYPFNYQVTDPNSMLSSVSCSSTAGSTNGIITFNVNSNSGASRSASIRAFTSGVWGDVSAGDTTVINQAAYSPPINYDVWAYFDQQGTIVFENLIHGQEVTVTLGVKVQAAAYADEYGYGGFLIESRAKVSKNTEQQAFLVTSAYCPGPNSGEINYTQSEGWPLEGSIVITGVNGGTAVFVDPVIDDCFWANSGHDDGSSSVQARIFNCVVTSGQGTGHVGRPGYGDMTYWLHENVGNSNTGYCQTYEYAN